MLTTLAVANYRSLRDVVLPLGPLTVITGPNGSGKSSLYRALRLLADCAEGRVIGSLAREGGLDATLWAGPEHVSHEVGRAAGPARGAMRKEPINLKLGFAGEPFGYAIDLGVPTSSMSLFDRDPAIKREVLWAGPTLRPSATLLDRRNAVVEAHVDGAWQVVRADLSPSDSLFTASDPRTAPEALVLRQQLQSWRFYDQLRTDADAPIRRSGVGTRTWALAADGADLAAAWQTIVESGDGAALADTIADAFPGAEVHVDVADGRFVLTMSQPGLLRRLHVAELSDGTLRYLAWAAALLSPRPPSLLVLNEPETSLHPAVIPALARLIVRAAAATQVIVVSHAEPLVRELAAHAVGHALEKVAGATRIVGQSLIDRPSWRWPSR